MDQPKILSGIELVSKGVTKLEASLPEIGLKDVIPNGSWLEQKQIQSALEARKHLVEVDRIEKIGTLSHAVWHDDLKLAEVTKLAGGHWQYIGHNVGKTKLLYPEEVLYLMEVNCLLLTHNEVTVSLQKAYALLLNSSTSLTQYKVYSSLSRIGYKILRHKGPKIDSRKGVPVNIVDDKEDGQDMIVDASIETKDITTNIDTENVLESDNKKNIYDPITGKNDDHIGINKVVTKIIQVNEENESVSKTEPLPIGVDNTKELMITNEKNINMESKAEMSTNLESTKIGMDMVIEMNVTDNGEKDLECSNFETKDDVQTANGMDANTENSEPMDTDIQVIEEKNYANYCCVTVTSTESKSDNSLVGLVEDQSMLDVIQIEDDESTKESLVLSTMCQSNRTIDGYISKLNKLPSRNLKPSNSKSLHKYFESVPDLLKKQVITVNVPDQEYLPKNIFVNRNTYTLNLPNIKRKKFTSNDSASYGITEEANGTHIRRIRSSSSSELSQNPPIATTGFPNMRSPGAHLFFRPAPFWRPQNNLNYFQFSMFFQRPAFSNMFMHSRFHYQPRPPPLLRSVSYPDNLNPDISNSENNKRLRNGRNTHLRNIKMLAHRLKQLIQTGNPQTQSIAALKSLLHSYNYRYKSKLRLSENFNIIDEETVVETIELDDEDETRSKRPRLEKDDDLFHENLEKLRQLAAKLRVLEEKGKATARQRRVFSNAIKTFNNSFDGDVYLNSDYKIIDRRHITLDTSSESDCVVEDTKKVRKGKKLRNPFNILKRMSQKFDLSTSSDEKAPGVGETEFIENSQYNELITKHNKQITKYNEQIKKTFNKNWLPDENDFGRAEVLPKHLMNSRIIDSNKEIFLYDFMKEQFEEYDNWLEAKTCFLRHIEETNIAIQNQQEQLLAESKLSDSELKPIIDSEDCSNMPSILEKLRIIENNKTTDTEISLSIDFDVYKRDVPNFKKTNPPKPHFRIICIKESTSFPTAAHVRALQSKYDDNVAIVFAIVGTGSISYLQINPIDLPVYVPSNDLT